MVNATTCVAGLAAAAVTVLAVRYAVKDGRGYRACEASSNYIASFRVAKLAGTFASFAWAGICYVPSGAKHLWNHRCFTKNCGQCQSNLPNPSTATTEQQPEVAA